MKIVIASRTPWIWEELKHEKLGAEILEIREPGELSLEALDAFRPRWVFFPHWSHKVPTAVLDRYECVCFHAAPLPFGRGGSPVQNLIARGYEETDVCALRMVEEFDAGPVYMREKVSLLGGGEEVYMRLNRVIALMIARFVEDAPTPLEQVGEITTFKRRKPAESELDSAAQILDIFNQIRMLDVPGYPRAFLEIGDLRLEFDRPALTRDGIKCDVIIKSKRERQK